jgi:hypothetical protein
MIEFDQDSCRDLNVALTREWLETNGIGGFFFFPSVKFPRFRGLP